jgi:hypothetical protein
VENCCSCLAILGDRRGSGGGLTEFAEFVLLIALIFNGLGICFIFGFLKGGELGSFMLGKLD